MFAFPFGSTETKPTAPPAGMQTGTLWLTCAFGIVCQKNKNDAFDLPKWCNWHLSASGFVSLNNAETSWSLLVLISWVAFGQLGLESPQIDWRDSTKNKNKMSADAQCEPTCWIASSSTKIKWEKLQQFWKTSSRQLVLANCWLNSCHALSLRSFVGILQVSIAVFSWIPKK